MLEELKKQANITYTENGEVTLQSTGSDCLNFFALAGGIRFQDEKYVRDLFTKAYIENKLIATKLMFYARDAREGLGERNTFRVCARWLADFEPETLKKNLTLFSEYGRYDDLLCLLGTRVEEDVLQVIKTQLEKDINDYNQNKPISLLAKWLPSINATSEETVENAKKVAKYLNMNHQKYRKTLAALRKHIRIIENFLREKDYTFDYQEQPSKAMLKYRAAFYRNDGERYSKFLECVSVGKAKLNTAVLTPVDIVNKLFDYDFLSPEDRKALDVTWNALPDYTNDENALVVMDGSGSMYLPINPKPITVATSLAVYFAERNKGVFHNHFITFSTKPQLIEIKGNDINEKIKYCSAYDEAADTNIEAVYNLILHTAVDNNLPQSEMPSTIYIISDMEFNACAQNADVSVFEYAKEKFAWLGYKLPRIVFWNVCAHSTHFPVRQNEQGVALVSGNSPKLFSLITSGELSPIKFMLDVINSKRYAAVRV